MRLLSLMRMKKTARTSKAEKRVLIPKTSRTSTVPMACRFRLALLLVDVLQVLVAVEIVVLVAADAEGAADVVLVRAAVVAETRAATLAAEHRRAAAIGSRSQHGNSVRVALRRGPFAFKVRGW